MRKQNIMKKKFIQKFFLLLAILISAVFYVWYIWTKTENEQIENVLRVARSIEASLPNENLHALEISPSDLEKPQYQGLKKALKAAIKVNPEARFAYIFVERNDKIYFVADSEPEDSEDYSPPGQEYTEDKPEDKQPFRDGKELITSPLTDRWGTWRSVYIPVKDEVTGETIAIFGMDFNSKSWNKYLLLKVIQSTFVILLLLAFLLVIQFQAKNKLLHNEITKRKKVEKELKDSLDRNKAILEANPDMMFIFDSECNIVDYHSAHFDHLLVKPEMFLGKMVDDILPQEIALVTHEKVRAVLSTGKPEYSTYKLQTDSELKSYESRYVPCGKKDVLAIVREITERMKAEEALRISEERLRLSLSAANQGLYDINVQTGDAVVNAEYASMLGYDPETFKETNSLWIERLHPEDKEIAANAYLNYIEGRTSEFRIEFRQKTSDNSWIWILSVGKIVEYDSEGKPLRMLGTHLDITERKKAEVEITKKNKELLNLNATKDKFFSIIAHDLRDPFNSFLGLTQIMAEELPSLTMAQIQEIAITMSNSASNLYRLLENLLQWARMQQGIVPFNPDVVPLQMIVDESMEMIQESAKSKEIELATDIPDGLGVFADSNMLQTVIRNLVSNAVKFTSKGGKVSLSARANSDKSVEISIQDTGIGMSQTMIDNLFRIDLKTNRLGTEGEPSTGLGLMLCKEFIEKHGGKIWVESEVDKGSVFYFTLPCKSLL